MLTTGSASQISGFYYAKICPMLRPHIVILGAGFGGTYVAKSLVPLAKKGEIDVTIVNRTNYFLFTPLLHEVATGSLSPRSVAEPLREVFAGSGVRIVQGIVDEIDRASRIVKVKAGGHAHDLAYDYLIIATGAETNYYGIAGAPEFALPLKSLADASNIRNRIIDAFEHATLEDDSEARRSLLSFAVVGGGATGVELSAELADLVHSMSERYYHPADGQGGSASMPSPSITLVNAGKELIEMFAPSLRVAAAGRLAHRGVKVMNSMSVTAVTKQGLTFADGSMIHANTVIWTAGVKAIIPNFTGNQPTLAGGRFAVDSSFRLLGEDRIFALGDAAAYVDPRDPAAASGKARPLPMLAQVAERESETVSANVIALIRGRRLRDFHYVSRGSMVSVGGWFAIGEILSVRLAGRLTWWLWRTVYIFKFASWRKRIRIGFEWAFELVSPRDITKL